MHNVNLSTTGLNFNTSEKRKAFTLTYLCTHERENRLPLGYSLRKGFNVTLSQKKVAGSQLFCIPSVEVSSQFLDKNNVSSKSIP